LYLSGQVEGNAGEGVVVVEGTRTGFRTELKYLRLDTPSKRLVIKGDTETHERLDDWAGAITFGRKALPVK
jgi:hypothetical protein